MIFQRHSRKKRIEKQHQQLAELIENESETLYRLALSYTHQKEDALDVLQDSFQKALISIEKTNEIQNFHAWYYRILINTATDFWRKKQKIPVTESIFENQLQADAKVFDQFELYAVLDQVASPEREILILKFFEGFRLTEIAEILQLNENTVKTKMYRALNQLRKILG